MQPEAADPASAPSQQARGGRAAARRGVLVAAALLAAGTWGSGAVLAQQTGQGVDFSAVAGQQFTTTVATFEGSGTADNYSAVIAWGDGSAASEGTVSGRTSCPFPDATCLEVTGTHTYASPGTYTVTVTITGIDIRTQTTATATVTAPPGPPLPGPQPPPPAPAPLAAAIRASPSPVTQDIVTLDAAASTGPIDAFQFDIDGNGSYETLCTTPYADVAYSRPGRRTVGVRVLSRGGAASLATVSVDVGSATSLPRNPVPPGATVGGCAGDASASAGSDLAALLLCPKTVKVGVAELSLPSRGFPGACFEFATIPLGLKLGVAPAPTVTVASAHEVEVKGWRAAVDQPVAVNGLRLTPHKGSRIVATTVTERVLAVAGSVLGHAKVTLERPAPGGVNFDLGATSPTNWNVAKPSIVQTIDLGGTLFGLEAPLAEVPLALTDGGASLPLRLSPPSPLGLAPTLIWNGLCWPKCSTPPEPVTSMPLLVKTTSTGDVTPVGGALFGDLPLRRFTAKHVQLTHGIVDGQDVWTGTLMLKLPLSFGGAELDGGWRIEDGELGGTASLASFAGVRVACCRIHSLSATVGSIGLEGKATFVVRPFLVPGIPLLTGADASIKLPYDSHEYFVEADKLANLSLGVAGAIKGAATGALFKGTTYPAWDLGKFTIKTASVTGGLAGSPYTESVEGWTGKATDGLICLDPALVKGLVTTPLGSTPADPCNPGWALIGSKAIAHCRTLYPKDGGVKDVGVYRKWTGETGTFAPCEGKTQQVAASTARAAASSPLVAARLTATGSRRTLRYRLPRGLIARFFERAAGLNRLLGRSRAARGTLTFTPVDGGPRRRSIVAFVEDDGVPIRELVVARFRASAPRPVGRPRVTVRRLGSTLIVRWTNVAGARAYVVRVQLTDGTHRLFTSRSGLRGVRLTGVGVRVGGIVAVRGIGAGTQLGRVAATRVRPVPAISVARRIGARALTTRGVPIRCAATADGTCTAIASAGAATIGQGAVPVRAGRRASLGVRLTKAGRRRVRGRRSVQVAVLLPGERPRHRTVSIVPE
jgi:PKD repeat protein